MTSSSQFSRVKHDVFISFRGPDVRRGFLSHLIKELKQKQIGFYVDDRLERGEEISPSLFRAIEESHISLIIFSKRYAFSRWCLEELVKIIECMDRKKQIVIPIFYNIDPSVVREQKGSYGKALAKLFDKHEERMQDWRSALGKAGNISGFHATKYRNEAELIEEIAKSLSPMVKIMCPSDSAGFVGIEEKIADLEFLMCNGHVIGIWGMGGVGKTTLATAMFNRLCSNFEGFCFVANVGEEIKNGTINLRNKILSKLLKEHDLHIDTPEGIPTYVKGKLSRIKVLLVLDGVSDSDQVEKLFGSFDCFGFGSKIIITTRDKQVLGKIDQIYEVKPLIFDHAIQLFMSKALDKNCVDKEWIDLTKEVTHYAQGSPLALKVLSTFLYGKNKEEWKSQLKKLEKMPPTKIYDVLRLSYDSLDDHQVKDIFLYIACFLKGYEQCQIIALLDACGFETNIGLKELEDKALITRTKCWSSKRLIVSMHDLIQKMGKEIVRRESMENPEKRSRLWDPNDIYKVLENDMGTEAIQSISLENSRHGKEFSLNPLVFARMCKLKFLKVFRTHVCLPQGLEYLPNELRLLHWHCYPLESLPWIFRAKNLVILQMTHSRLKKLWDGTMPLENLKKINLGHSKDLLELPNLSMANNLEEVQLRSCENLREVHPSILSLHKLEILDLSFCRKLTRLRGDFHLRSLYQLVLYGCSRLKGFSVTSENMRMLDLSYTDIEELPLSIGCLSKLEELNLESCERLMHLPSNLVNLRSLRCINIRGCTQLQSLPDLPPSINQVFAANCSSLETVQFASGAADLLNRGLVSIEFGNCINLDEHILKGIESIVHLNLINYVFQQKSPEEHKIEKFGIQAFATYPGSEVPDWFQYRSSTDSITIAPESMLQALIFCAIVEPKESESVYIEVACFLDDVELDGDSAFTTKLISDNVCLWCNEFLCKLINEGIQENRARNLNSTYNPIVSFEFRLTTLGSCWFHDPSIDECGVYPIGSACRQLLRGRSISDRPRQCHFDSCLLDCRQLPHGRSVSDRPRRCRHFGKLKQVKQKETEREDSTATVSRKKSGSSGRSNPSSDSGLESPADDFLSSQCLLTSMRTALRGSFSDISSHSSSESESIDKEEDPDYIPISESIAKADSHSRETEVEEEENSTAESNIEESDD